VTDRDLLTEIAALRAELAAQQRTIPALPEQHDGERIRWLRWEPAPTLSHVPAECYQCAHPGPLMLALGVAGEPGVIRYHASRCPSCQEMRVYRRDYAPYGLRVNLTEIAYHPPQGGMRA